LDDNNFAASSDNFAGGDYGQVHQYEEPFY